MSNNQTAGGYRYDIEDRAWLETQSMSKYDYAVVAATGDIERPPVVDPRPWFNVRNQGQEGSCQGHSITAAGEHCFRVASNGEVIRFSPDVAYYETQRIDGLLGADNGSTIAGGMKMARNLGFCPEHHMPYSDRYNPGALPKNLAELCGPYKIKKFKIFEGPDYFAETVEWIGLGLGGVSYGIDWGVRLDSLGVASWSPSNGGGHANACLGYTGPVDADGLPQLLIAVNSWGDWGPLKGWYLWRRAEFNKVMAHKWSVIVGISDMDDVKPRKIDWAADYPV